MRTAGMPRPKQFHIRLSKPEWQRLTRLAEFYGIDRAGLIRMLLKKADHKQATTDE